MQNAIFETDWGAETSDGRGERMTGIEVIDKYTNYYFRQMRLCGYSVQRDQIASELGFVYAKALDRKNRGLFKDQGADNAATASFDTYCAKGFANQICTFKKQLIEQSIEARNMVAFNDGCIWDEDGVMADDAMIGKEIQGEILTLFDGLRQAIAGELICPSQAVVDAIKRHRDVCRIPKNLLKGRSTGSLPKAIAQVYNIAERKARYEIGQVKNIIRNELINLACIIK